MHDHAQETGWQTDVRSPIMLGLPTHLVQELHVGTVDTWMPSKVY